jgi:hypothetical protein
MQKTLLRSATLAGAVVFTVAAAAPVASFAQSARAQEAQMQAPDRREAGQERRGATQERKQAAQAKLNEARLKACQKREKNIKNIMTRITNRGTKQLDVFTRISDRTQKFYKEKGKTLSNYDALVSDVNARKAAAAAAVEAARTAGAGFKCDGDDPKGAAGSFKESRKAQKAALKEYKTAVKKLVAGSKSAQSPAAAEGSSEGSRQ